MLANVTAYVVSQIHNFIWCKYWIFPLDKENKKNTVWHQMLFFAGAFALAYSAQFVFLLVLVAGAVWPLAFRPMSKWGKRKK